MRLASRHSNLGTETAFEVLARAKQLEREGRDIVHLEIGEPDFDTPLHIREAAKRALDDGWTHYGPSAGQPELRRAIAEHQTKSQGYPVNEDSVIVTPGGKPVMFFTILATVGPGDEAIYPNPGFPIYESMIGYVGGRAIPLRLREENAYNPSVDELSQLINSRTRLLIINSPSNPCGSVLPLEDMERIAALAVEHDLVVLTDEIYKDMYYKGKHESITQFRGMRERTVILDGFSKSYAMTGWRLGYGIFPDWMREAVVRLMTNSVSCTSVFSQMAAIQALKGPQNVITEMMTTFRQRRKIIVNGLNNLPGVVCPTPAGAFYAFPSIAGTGMSSAEFANRSLEEAGVALLSGTSFGVYGDGFIRVSFANSEKNLYEALERLHTMLGG